MEPMFDRSTLTANDQAILTDFYSRRKLLDSYIKDKGLNLFTCPGCGYPTLNERGIYEICAVCFWEDDHQDEKDADKVWGGPNGNLSLTENRIIIGRLLLKNADSLRSVINLDPAFILNTLALYNKKKNGLESRMTGDEKPDDPLEVEWNQLRPDLQVALCRGDH